MFITNEINGRPFAHSDWTNLSVDACEVGRNGRSRDVSTVTGAMIPVFIPDIRYILKFRRTCPLLNNILTTFV